MRIEGAVVLITGASSGIGLATARAFSASGARVALAARSAQALEDLVQELGGASVALALPCDVSDPVAAAELVTRTVEVFGGLDVLVNNAGIGHYGSLIDAPWTEIEQVFATNLFGPIHLIRAAVPVMRRRGGGVIINVSSVNGRRALPLMAAYSASKYALNGIADALRVELSRDRIAVVTLLPGAVRTRFNTALLGKPPSGGRRGGPFPSSPERVARRIVDLARHPRPIAYVTFRDRLWVWLSLLAPRLVDLMLGRVLRSNP
ncbi:MAG: short-chain dehydrogenase [Herpetosiphonaceae bacterium]|nr:MAG: short-chain dehydrogenase [Herpetosiphonaceae bacterium]